MRVRRFLFLAVVLAAACSEKNQLPTYDLSGDTMGTTFNVTLVAPPIDTDFDALQTRIYERLEHVEDIASTYRSESELSQFNADPSVDWIKVKPEFCHMVVAALDVSFLTKGAFDITQSIDKNAQVVQDNWEALGIPEKIAMDYALKSDLITQAIEVKAFTEAPMTIKNDDGAKVPGTLKEDNTNADSPKQKFDPADITDYLCRFVADHVRTKLTV